MVKQHRKHLKSRKIQPFNTLSRVQEDAAQKASTIAWKYLLKKYPQYDFNNLQTLGLNEINAQFAVEYINRGIKLGSTPKRIPNELQAFSSAKGIRPDGGVFFVKSKIDGFDHIIGTLEVKHQGEYDGYTPLSDSDWKKKKGDPTMERKDRPPQAQGNAIERFAKNANAIKTLTSFYGYNPYIVFCEGFDFYLDHDYELFQNQPYANRFKGKDSSILMRLVAGNDWLPLNTSYVDCIKHGKTFICPATIFARMPKWSSEEIVDVMMEVFDKSIKHLNSIGEL